MKWLKVNGVEFLWVNSLKYKWNLLKINLKKDRWKFKLNEN